MSAAITSVLVVIPARDEQELLPRCLNALAAAVAEFGIAFPAVEVRSAVVADLTTDGSREIVATCPTVELLVVEHGNVGAARAAGVTYLLGSGGHPASTWIATTDADSVVPRAWLIGQVELANTGADVILGSVAPEPDGLSAAQLRAWQEFRRMPDPTGDIHGANLGIRASVYGTLGGFEPRAVGEDVDLVRRAATAGFVTVQASGPPVMTSSRTDGRAPDGYSSWLHRGGLIAADPAGF